MNIYTFTVKKRYLIAAAAVLVLLLVLLILPRGRAESTAGSMKIRSQSDCESYLSQLGYQVEESTAQCRAVVIPAEFDAVYTAYNEMQKSCGYDLAPWAGKKAQLYTFTVTNYPGDDAVLADVLVAKHRIIGGAVYTAAVDGFMVGLVPLSQLGG